MFPTEISPLKGHPSMVVCMPKEENTYTHTQRESGRKKGRQAGRQSNVFKQSLQDKMFPRFFCSFALQEIQHQ